MRPGFDAQLLVNRGVFDSLEEADAILCRLDEARTRSVITASSWQLGLGFTVPIEFTQGSRGLAETHNLSLVGATPTPAPILPQREVGETPNLRGYNMGDANRPKDWAGEGNKPLMRSLTAMCSRSLEGIAPQNLWQSPPVLGAGSNTADLWELATPAPALPPSTISRSLVRSGSAAVVSHPLQDGTAAAECSAGKQLEIACQSNSFCPWCAIEAPGQGAAPRAGFVSSYRCARHAPNPEPAGTPVQCPQPTTARDALSHAPAVVLRLPVSHDAAPFHPRLNPNAGVVPAFPKGRWS